MLNLRVGVHVDLVFVTTVRAWRRYEQRERNHCPVAEQVDVEQLRDRLWAREQDAAARLAGRDRTAKCQLVEVFVDFLVGAAAEFQVH
jgi:hypothetical protein